MTTDVSQTLWVHRAKEQLRQLAPAQWNIHLYTYRYTKDLEQDESQLSPASFVGDSVEQSMAATVAKLVTSFHFTIVANLKAAESGPGSAEVRSYARNGSIYAVPVFRPNVYDPSPIMRPLLGVVCFASDLSTEEVILNYDLHVLADRFAGIAADEYFKILKTSPLLRTLAWEEIREDIVTHLAPQPLTSMEPLSRKADSGGAIWWEFKPGCFARESDVRKVQWFQERSFVADKPDRWLNPTDVPGVTSTGLADIEQYISTGAFAELYKKISTVTDAQTRAARYYEIAMISMERDDKFNSIIAANKYQEVRGQTPNAYELLGHVYWWFEDIDRAIKYAKKAFELACSVPEDERKKDRDVINRTKNNLAFFYAEKQIEKDLACSYVSEILTEVSSTNEFYQAYLDTAGYVYTRFASKDEDIDKAISCFLKVLEMEPQSKDTQEHLIEAYEKRKLLRKDDHQ